MSSFLAKLHLEGKTYNILKYRIHIIKDSRNIENPKGKKIIKNLYLEVESQGNETKDLLVWSLSHTNTKSGKIIFLKRDGMSKLQEIQLKNSYCTHFEEEFNSIGSDPMSINLTITRGILCGNEIQNQLIFKEPDEAPKKEPEIVEMYWTYGKDFTPLSDKSRFYPDMNLHIKTRYYKEGEAIEIKVKNEDNFPLTDEIQEISLTGKVKDDKIVFENIFKEHTLNLLNEE